MPWLQLETRSGQANPAELEARLEALGAVSVALRDAGDQPLLEPKPGETPLWSSTIVTALFPANVLAGELSAALGELIDPDDLRFTEVEDQDWQAAWRQELKARQFGRRLWVVPTDAEAPRDAAVVKPDPGLAFGTGEHATTAMCLAWLDEVIKSGDSVLDYGCGSGLLALAALQLGATEACATDIDPQALEATRRNAAANGCADRLRAVGPELVDNTHRFDVLVANILSGTLIELGPVIEPLVRPGARLALTGILAEQADEVAQAWSGWATLHVDRQVREWVLLTGVKNPEDGND